MTGLDPDSQELKKLNTTHPITEGKVWIDSIPHGQWFKTELVKAWEEFSSLPMPKRKDEDWRFSSINAIRLDPYHIGEPVPDDQKSHILQKTSSPSDSISKAVFADRELLSFDDIGDDLKAKGILWKPLSAAFHENRDLLEKYFFGETQTLGSSKFLHLHRVFSQSGMLLYVPKNVRIEGELTVHHWLARENASCFPHTIIVAGENSEVFLSESFHSLQDHGGFACAVHRIHAGAGSNVHYAHLQNWGEKVLAFSIGHSTVEKDAHLKNLGVQLGGSFVRTESKSDLAGSGSKSEMLSVAAIHGQQEYDQRTLQCHKAPHTWSDLLYKNALSHKSKSIFQGLIQVDKPAMQTDAYQTNRNLLLHPEAEADSMPGLEIENDDVKCSHGATTGQIHEDELFYLLARGIHPSAARQLMVNGFLDEVLDRFGKKSFAENVRAFIEQKFKRTRSIPWESLKTPGEEQSKSGEDNFHVLQGSE